MYEKEENNKYLRPKLLFVDDDQITIDVVVRILKNKYDVDTVTNGQDALKKAKENYYDAFLIDIELPGGMDGIQTTSELKKIKDNINKPFIAITAFALVGDKEAILSQGLTHYISKPFEFKKLIDLIQSALE